MAIGPPLRRITPGLGPASGQKLLDDRLGVVTLIELIKHAPDNIDLLAAFTVQEEVGLRGAHVAAYSLNPDVGIAVDSTPAMDLPAWDGSSEGGENSYYNTRLDAGPAIYLADSATLADPRLVRHLVDTAESAEHSIPDPPAWWWRYRRRRDQPFPVRVYPVFRCPFPGGIFIPPPASLAFQTGKIPWLYCMPHYLH